MTVTNKDHRLKVSNTHTRAAAGGRLSLQECVNTPADSSSEWSAVHSVTTGRQKVQSSVVNKTPDRKEI